MVRHKWILKVRNQGELVFDPFGGYGVSWADLQGNENSWRNGYPSELECKVAGWKKALEYIGNLEHNARTSPAEKLREMIQDEIKRLTRPQVVQLELFSF